MKILMLMAIYWYVFAAASVGSIGYSLMVSPLPTFVLWTIGGVAIVAGALRLLINGINII